MNWVDGGEIKEESNWVRKESYEEKKKDRKVEPRVSYKGTKFLKMRRSYKSGKTMRSDIDKFEKEREREREKSLKKMIFTWEWR